MELMRQRLFRVVGALAVLTAAWLSSPPSGSARPPTVITLSGGCTDLNHQSGFCSRMAQKPGSPPFFELESFDGGGRFKFCVRPPLRPERCLSRQLHKDAEAWSARINVFDVWRPTGGAYSGRWIDTESGQQVGPTVEWEAYKPSEVPSS
jgi:hypothetical protein